MSTRMIEPLESRIHFAAQIASIGENVNISREALMQWEGTVAINPANPQNIFAASNTRAGFAGLFAGVSFDGGQTWATQTLATGNDGLDVACCNVIAAFDDFGNLHVTYLNFEDGFNDSIQMLLSTDGGQTFAAVGEFRGAVDRPTLAVGPSDVWVTWDADNSVAVSHARIRGFGQVDAYTPFITVTEEPTDNIRDLAVGPRGQVLITYPIADADETSSVIHAQLDPDGRGRKQFGARHDVGPTNVEFLQAIPPQSVRAIDSATQLAYDRSGGPYTGRAYLVYSDEAVKGSNDTDTFIRFSEDDGVSWSDPIRIDDDTTGRSQFYPRIAVDQTTGNVGVSWLDARNDAGERDVNSFDALPNTDTDLFATVATPTASGLDVALNVKVSAGYSSAAATFNRNEYGDYTGVAFHAGILRPVWADNSNSTGDNPEGAFRNFDLFTAAVNIQSDAATSFGAPTVEVVHTGKRASSSKYEFKVIYRDADKLNKSSINSRDILVTGPRGFSKFAKLVGTSSSGKGSVIKATYRVTAPGGKWDSRENGIYTFQLRANQVRDKCDQFAVARNMLGKFAINLQPRTTQIASGNALRSAPIDDRARTLFSDFKIVDPQTSTPF